MKTCPKCDKRFAWTERLCDGCKESLEQLDAELGTVIGDRYKLKSVLGKGGMGIVYVAEHIALEREVALKFLRGKLADDPVVLKRFQREARAASAIKHPGIVDVTDFGEDKEHGVYYVMEYVAGAPLTDRLDKGLGLPINDILTLGAQMADALQAAHAQGIVHRDLKPDNILLIKQPDGATQAKILDFGIAGVQGQGAGDEKLTVAGSIFGTARYMSPEQASGADLDHRTDIYTLGVILYEMTTGSLPFGGTMLELLEAHRSRDPDPPSTRRPGLPNSIERPILRCMSKHPDHRYQTMTEVKAALKAVGEVSEDTILPEMLQDLAAAGTVGPGSFPPGSHPPGSHPPGSYPPGSQPPGSHPPGSYPPGSYPPGSQQAGSYPPGSYPPGAYPQGAYPQGSHPPGTYPPGTYPPGSYPPGSHPPGTYPPGSHPPMSTTNLGAGELVGQPKPPGSKAPWVISAVLGLVLAVGGTAWFMARPAPAPQDPPTPAAKATTPAPAPAKPERIGARLVETTPEGAEVYQGANYLGRTPVKVPIPEDAADVIIELRLEGHMNGIVTLDRSSGDAVSVKMKALPASAAPSPAEAAPATDKKKKKKRKKKKRKSRGLL